MVRSRRVVFLLAASYGVLSACTGPTRPSTVAPSLAGQWSGTTSQGVPISFSVADDEKVTTLIVGYNFNGCSGSQAFLGLTIGTAPDVTCIPGPCSGSVASYRAFSYSTSGPMGGPRTAVNGVFLSADRAEGQVNFVNYSGCGTANGVAWTATRGRQGR